MSARVGPSLEIRDLTWGVEASLKAGDPPILNGMELVVEQGEWVALVGPSGAGKTTFLSLCAGLLAPTTGTVVVLGRSVTRTSDEELSRLRATHVGLIFQNYHLDDSRTALENILLPGYFGSGNWHELNQRAEGLGAELGLSEHLQKPASVLSGGQRQRVAIARALLAAPDLILADEPTGALDKETADLVLAMLSQSVANGSTLISVTHDPAVIERAHRCFAFRDGTLVEVGS